ncbi:MAG TPA: serine/threonine-protein kinase, partial [Vicinamibacteria bacterium]
MAPTEDEPDPITACTRCDKDHDRGSVECPARRVGTTLDGRYRLDHLIGSGGCGAVFAATHLRLGTRVAVKTLLARLARNGDLARRFLREAQSAAGLSHPGIVKVTDFGSAEDGAPYLVMEHVAASNLGALVGRNALTPAQVASLATKILEALAAAHRAGIVHRDLKPANILYLPQAGGEAQVKIVDFGLAKVAESSDPRLTETGEFFGTPQYVSPEQLQDSKAADVRSDLYSVGAVLYFLLTGRSHVGSGTVPEILSRVLQGSFERHPRLVSTDTPPWLDAVVARSLAHDPKERFASADEMRSGILRADPEVSDPASLTLSLVPFESGRSGARRLVGRSRATAALLAVVALLGLAWSRWIRSTASGPPGAAGPGDPRMVPIAAGPFRMGSTEEEIAAAYSWCRE